MNMSLHILGNGQNKLTLLIPCRNDCEVSAALGDGGVGGTELQIPNVARRVPTPAGII